MPTYEYRCLSCGHEFELFRKMSEQAHAECPECGSQAERLISGGAGLVFKGSGFYITDYRSASYKEAAKKETAGGKGEGGEGGEKKTASKEKSKPKKAAE